MNSLQHNVSSISTDYLNGMQCNVHAQKIYYSTEQYKQSQFW